jgi:hypothetical protein
LGFRFQKRISILPGVRINLSKSGVSTSLGPRGADVNIGKDGVTANAGIPGTGLSYRQKLGGGASAKKTKGGLLGVLAVVGGLGFWAFQHAGKIEGFLVPSALRTASGATGTSPASASRAGEVRPVPTAANISTDASTGMSTDSSTDRTSTLPAGVNTSANMQRYVHRKTAILREKPKASGNILKRELKGSSVTLVSQRTGGWSEVMDGNITGYMRSGTLGIEPPK